MDEAFQRMRKKSASGETLPLYRSLMDGSRFGVGAHKKTKLRIAGASESGSLLHECVSSAHAAVMSGELVKKAKKLGGAAEHRLKFVTLLEAVVEPTVEAVAQAVADLEASYKTIFDDGGFWSRGAIELEMVNLAILRRISEQSDNEARKLNVLTDLQSKIEFAGLMIPRPQTESLILVHSHTVVDLGPDPVEGKRRLENRMKRYGRWTAVPYQHRIDSLFKNRKTASNLERIAAYVTKGGNENLRYNAGFGRDLAEDVEAKILKRGRTKGSDHDELVEDERGLTIAEVRQLDLLYVWLMNRRKDKRGYVLWSSGQKKPRG